MSWKLTNVILYHGHLSHFEIIDHDFPEKYQVFGYIFVSLYDQLSQGQGHNSQLTDINLLLEGVEQVEICFTAHHEWIVRLCNQQKMKEVVYSSKIIQ